MAHKATMISIVTEKIIQDQITKLVEEAGATGYTVLAGGGKGSHGVRSSDGASVVSAFSNVKIEVLTSDRAMAEAIADDIAAKFFDNFAGIIYLHEVEVLRPHKFQSKR